MKAKDMIRQIIREELQTIIEEQAQNWWHAPAEAEKDGHLEPSKVHEAAKEKQRRPGVGKKKKSGRFTSAGSIPTKHGRKLTNSQIKTREEIGKKMLNTFRRGGEVGRDFRKSLVGALESQGLPTDKNHQLSKIWARASAMAANGSTAADFPPKKKKSKKKREQ